MANVVGRQEKEGYMRIAVLALIGAVALGALTVSAQASPTPPPFAPAAASGIVEVWGGCGWGFHPTAWGGCAPNRYGYYRPAWRGYYWNRPYWRGYYRGGYRNWHRGW